MELDAKDRRILQLLRDDATISHERIGAKIHLATSTVSRRVQDLEKAGYILGYRAILNPARLGLGTTVLMQLRLNAHDPRTEEEFEHAIGTHFPSVIECMQIMGSWDYVLRIVVANLDQYELIRVKLSALPMVNLTRATPVTGVIATKPLPILS